MFLRWLLSREERGFSNAGNLVDREQSLHLDISSISSDGGQREGLKDIGTSGCAHPIEQSKLNNFVRGELERITFVTLGTSKCTVSRDV